MAHEQPFVPPSIFRESVRENWIALIFEIELIRNDADFALFKIFKRGKWSFKIVLHKSIQYVVGIVDNSLHAIKNCDLSLGYVFWFTELFGLL